MLLTSNNFQEIAILLKKDNALDEAQQQLKKEIPSLLVASQEISPEGEKIPANAHTGFLPAQWNF